MVLRLTVLVVVYVVEETKVMSVRKRHRTEQMRERAVIFLSVYTLCVGSGA